MISTLLLPLAALLGGATLPSQDPVPAVPPPPAIPPDTVIITTPSGLQYSVLAEGDGTASPAFGDQVRVHYTGWLLDGTVFDSSRQRGEPAEFAVGRVIPGWNEALELMSPGSRMKLTIPADLAYGEETRPGIPAGSTLIFDVELIAITARTLPFVAWDETKAQTLPCGLPYVVLEAGEGSLCSEADVVSVAFALYGEDNLPIVSSAMEGAPILGSPKQMPLAFLNQLMTVAKSGTRMVVRVPFASMSRLKGMPGVEEGKSYTWQIQVLTVMTFEKPAFVLPPAEELTTTASGLKYKVLREGVGTKPTITSSVVAHYAGWLEDGTPFDNSYDRGQPSTFPLARVVAGWTEGLQLMAPGAKVLFVIPSELGYGAGGSPPTIPGGATLVFVVELVAVQ